MTSSPTAQVTGAAPRDVFDPYDLSLRRDPYPSYRRFLEENPVHRAADETGSWVVSRHEHVSLVLRDPRFCAAAPEGAEQDSRDVLAELGIDEELAGQAGDAMLFKDPPDHTRMRRLLGRAFAPRAIEALRPRVEELVDELLGAVEPRGRMDLVEDFAHPLPIMVICEMLDVPAGDRPRFRELSRDLAGIVDIPLSHDVLLRGLRAAAEFAGYFRELVAHRRRRPGDDVISQLAAAEGQPDGLTESELLATCIQLLFGGHETTQNLIGNGTLALLRQPDALERLRAEPGLRARAVEELLRYDSPGQLAGRWVAQDVELGGQTLRAGERVTALLGAANRDPRVHEDPDRLHLDRRPNQHVSFGAGIHFCLGAPLARLEGQLALAALTERLPDLALTSEEPQWRDTLALRGLRRLPVRF